MTIHLQDPNEDWYTQPACGAHCHHEGPTTEEIGAVNCAGCLAIIWTDKSEPDHKADDKERGYE